MFRINILCILADFVGALYFETSRVQRFVATIVFFAFPVALGFVSHCGSWSLPKEQFSSLISIFAIFSALLFGAQISAFSIYRSMMEQERVSVEQANEDELLQEDAQAKARERLRDLPTAFRQVNANISYLILLSVLLLFLMMPLVFSNTPSVCLTAVVVGMTVHLLIILLMVIKQCHLIFDAAYSGDQS